MQKPTQHPCPDCDDLNPGASPVDRRAFLRLVGGGAAALTAAAAGLPAVARAAGPVERQPKPAEALIQELFSTLSDAQKKAIALPWDHGGGGKGQIPSRLRMYNSAFQGQSLGEVYTKGQQELVDRILRSVLSGEEGYRRISREGAWDNSKAFVNCGSHIFGEAVPGKKYAWVFTGHHLTLRCDGNSLEGAAFGGPMYYGHLANGYSEKNVFNYQTKGVLNVYETLDAKQRGRAVIVGSPGEQSGSVQFRGPNEAKPGIGYADLSGEQKALVEKVMRDILAPYRREDTDEVMQIVKANGGLEKLHLAFYRDKDADENERWHFWRLEGPGFVWNYRVLPHVHCFVNIANVKA